MRFSELARTEQQTLGFDLPGAQRYAELAWVSRISRESFSGQTTAWSTGTLVAPVYMPPGFSHWTEPDPPDGTLNVNVLVVTQSTVAVSFRSFGAAPLPGQSDAGWSINAVRIVTDLDPAHANELSSWHMDFVGLRFDVEVDMSIRALTAWVDTLDVRVTLLGTRRTVNFLPPP